MPGSVRLLLFGEPGASRDACLNRLRDLGVDVQVAGLRTLVRALVAPDDVPGDRLGGASPLAPHLVVVLDDGRELPEPPPIRHRRGALWLRIRDQREGSGAGSAFATGAARFAGGSGWDRELREPVSPALWTDLLADARGVGPFRRRSLGQPGVREAWMQYLERVSREPEEAREPREGREARESGAADLLRVLLVEDDRVVARVTRHRFEREGARVEVAGDRRTALDLFRRGGWDLVLADIRLGSDSGVELVAEMRRFEEETGRRRARILAFGEAPEGREAVEGGVAGFDGRVSKPLRQAEILAEFQAGLQMGPPADRPAGSGSAVAIEAWVAAESRGLLAAEVPLLVERLRSAGADLSGGGSVVLAALGHRLRGASAVVGEAGLEEAAKALEASLARLGAGAGAEALAEAEVRAGVERLIEALQRIRVKG